MAVAFANYRQVSRKLLTAAEDFRPLMFPKSTSDEGTGG